MSAIITDNMRLLNAKNFVVGITTSTGSYYTFLGLTNSTDYVSDWEADPPRPRDSFDQENDYWDTMISLKKINPSDVMFVIPKITWSSGTKYDMYRHDYSSGNLAPVSKSTNLYSSYFYVMNREFRVYICLQNGTNGDNPDGRPSLDEPTFTDLEPRVAGSSGDGYIWKYLYTLNPYDIIKFDSTKFIPVPSDWETADAYSVIRDNAVDGSIKVVTITEKGSNVGPSNVQYPGIPIKGDGEGAFCTITVDENSEVTNVEVSSQGSGYTYGSLDLESAGFPTASIRPQFDVIIPPQGGHGYNIYKELGAYNVLLYARIDNNEQNPDFVMSNKLARVGIVESPTEYNSNTVLNKDRVSAVGALKLTGIGYSTATFENNSRISQTVSAGNTAHGRVVSYNQTTGVLKYWQDRSLVGFNTYPYSNVDPELYNNNPEYGFELLSFTNLPDEASGGSLNIVPTNGSNTELFIDAAYSGISTTLNNNRTYYHGLSFVNGIALPEVKKHSGNIIYVDNRPSIIRSSNQKEDIKIVLQF